MRVLLQSYLASLKERGELDAMLPDLLSELGHTVLSRPKRGTAQRGVDIASVGPDADGETKLFLFSIKSGNVGRTEWSAVPQGVRSSIEEILDAYIPHRISEQFAGLKIVVAVVIGGELLEQARESYQGFTARHSDDRVSFQEWNGDFLALLILRGPFREEVMPRSLRASLQKAVAMSDQPEFAYRHFQMLADALREQADVGEREALRALRQLSLALWILYSWCREADNLEGAYRASEIAVLVAWTIAHPRPPRDGESNPLELALDQIIELHLRIADELLARIAPHLATAYAVSAKLPAGNPIDVNLGLFDLLGRLAMAGLWALSLRIDDTTEDAALKRLAATWCDAGVALIAANPALNLPISDAQTTSVTLMLLLWSRGRPPGTVVHQWLQQMVVRLVMTVRLRSRYPSMSSDYRDLLQLSGTSADDEAFRDATAASTLAPLLMAWLHALGDHEGVAALQKLSRGPLSHCTFQAWLADDSSELPMCLGKMDHGTGVCDLPVAGGGNALRSVLEEVSKTAIADPPFEAIRRGYWPIVLLACRHHQFPIPASIWVSALADIDRPEPPPASG